MTKRIEYSIPYNGDIELMKDAIRSGQVYEVYFSGPESREYANGIQHNSETEIGALVSLCTKKGIGRNLLINRSVVNLNNVKEVFSQIRSLVKYGGVTSVTVADRMIVTYIAKAFPDIIIQSSVFLHIDTANKVREAWKMGIKSFCLDVSMNRNGPELERIRDLKKYYPGMAIKLLVNHACFQNCFYSRANLDSPGNTYSLGDIINEVECLYREKNIGDQIKRSFIRPEDISYYEKNSLMDYAKIVDRMDETPHLRRKMEAYFNRSYDGDLFDISPTRKRSPFICQNKRFPIKFIDKVLYCGFSCETCHYCEAVASKILSKRESQVHKNAL